MNNYDVPIPRFLAYIAQGTVRSFNYFKGLSSGQKVNYRSEYMYVLMMSKCKVGFCHLRKLRSVNMTLSCCVSLYYIHKEEIQIKIL